MRGSFAAASRVAIPFFQASAASATVRFTLTSLVGCSVERMRNTVSALSHFSEGFTRSVASTRPRCGIGLRVLLSRMPLLPAAAGWRLVA